MDSGRRARAIETYDYDEAPEFFSLCTERRTNTMGLLCLCLWTYHCVLSLSVSHITIRGLGRHSLGKLGWRLRGVRLRSNQLWSRAAQAIASVQRVVAFANLAFYWSTVFFLKQYIKNLTGHVSLVTSRQKFGCSLRVTIPVSRLSLCIHPPLRSPSQVTTINGHQRGLRPPGIQSRS